MTAFAPRPLLLEARSASPLSDPGGEASPASARPGRGASLYDRRWRKARAAYLAANPLCVMCEQDGRLTPATVVDHVKPHRGDLALFWDRTGWQPLCKSHHDATKQRQEASGHAPGHDASGMPIDPAHPWARAAAAPAEAGPPPMLVQSCHPAGRTSFRACRFHRREIGARSSLGCGAPDER